MADMAGTIFGVAAGIVIVVLTAGWATDHHALSEKVWGYYQIEQKLSHELDVQTQRENAEAKKAEEASSAVQELQARCQTIGSQYRAMTDEINQANHGNVETSNTLKALQQSYDQLKAKFEIVCDNNRANYKAAEGWNNASDFWHRKFVELYDDVKNQRPVSSFTTDYVPSSNPGESSSGQAPVAPPPMTQRTEDSYFLPPTATVIDPQTGGTAIVSP